MVEYAKEKAAILPADFNDNLQKLFQNLFTDSDKVVQILGEMMIALETIIKAEVLTINDKSHFIDSCMAQNEDHKWVYRSSDVSSNKSRTCGTSCKELYRRWSTKRSTYKMKEENELRKNLDKLHTTELGVERIRRNLALETDDVVDWCKMKINSANAVITRSGKNWYVRVDQVILTVNAYSYTIITAHKEKMKTVDEYMNIVDYKEYISAETMMGPNSVRILAELFDKYPLDLVPNDMVLDLGCGTGLTSLIIAKETGARVYANDLWVSAEENRKRFAAWGVGDQITPICEDANNLHFEKEQFRVLISIDSYHYFAGSKGFFQEKILPFMQDDGVVLIGIPGLKEEYMGRAEELLSDWLGEDAYMFKSPRLWKELIGEDDRIESVKTWEMDCFSEAWDDWFATNNKFALDDRQNFEAIIKPYTCFVGIYIKLKSPSL